MVKRRNWTRTNWRRYADLYVDTISTTTASPDGAIALAIALARADHLHVLLAHDLWRFESLSHLHSTYRHGLQKYLVAIPYAESESITRVMAISVHPYLSGVPHRIGYLEKIYEHILARPGVLMWTGEQILDWYTGQDSD